MERGARDWTGLFRALARRAIRSLLAGMGRPVGPRVVRATFKVAAARPILDDESGKP